MDTHATASVQNMKRETVLTMDQLAAALGSRRRDGRPTNVETCRKWCLHGRSGVKLRSWVDVYVRKTTWGDYLDFRERLCRVREETRKRRLDAVRETQAAGSGRDRGARKRAADAKRRLEEMGAR